MKKNLLISLFVGALVCQPIFAQPEDNPSLQDVIAMVRQKNPDIKAAEQKKKQEKAWATVVATPADPVIGYSEMNRGSTNQYSIISQKLKFPVHYFLAAREQNKKADAADQRLTHKQLQVLAEVKTAYYSLYSLQKIIQLKEANIETVKAFARVAENKYASGQVHQQDSMKAHVEITSLQVQLMNLRNKKKKTLEKIKKLSSGAIQHLNLRDKNLNPPPLVNKNWDDFTKHSPETAPLVQAKKATKKATLWKRKKRAWDFAPDFQFTYQSRISGFPENSHIYSVNLTVPLWFWKNSSAYKAAAAEHRQRSLETTKIRDQVKEQASNLYSDIQTKRKTLKVYETSLIPQAKTAYNLSAAAYRSSQGDFLDFLNSEKVYYGAKADYYKDLKSYVKKLSKLEALTNQTLAKWSEVQK